jgi:hypothetical protein
MLWLHLASGCLEPGQPRPSRCPPVRYYLNATRGSSFPCRACHLNCFCSAVYVAGPPSPRTEQTARGGTLAAAVVSLLIIHAASDHEFRSVAEI